MSKDRESEEQAISRFDEILEDFINLAVSRFKWENLPLGLTSERLERMLIEHGQVFCYKRSEGDLVILPATRTNRINVYGEYTQLTINSFKGEFISNVDIDKGVLIKNNPSASGELLNLMKYARRIDNIEMTQDVNLFQQNVPKIVLTDENGKLTAKALIDQLKKFKVVIFGKKSLASQLTTSEVLDTSAPYLLDKLQDHKNNLINEVYTKLSINNFNSDKKERVNVDEVNANNDLIDKYLEIAYELRADACKLINEMFGKEMKVSKREVQNGKVYNDDRGNNKE